MNKVLTLFLLIFLCTYVTQAQWTSIGFYPDGSSYSVTSFVIGDNAYVGGGNLSKKSFYMLNLEEDSWTKLDDIPGGVNRASPIRFVIDGIAYIGAGGDRFQGSTKTFYAFDAETMEWTQKADFGGDFKHSGFYASVNGKGYVICGTDGKDPVADVWEYDPVGDTWKRKSDFPAGPVYWPAGFVVNDRLFVGTGSVDGEEIAELYEYDPDNDSWIERADFPGELRSAATGFAVNGKGYIGGGVNADFTGTHTDFFEYDPSNDTWKKADGMDFPIPNTAWSTAFVHNSTVYWGTGARLAGGVRPTPQWYKISLYTPPSFVGAEITNTTCEGGQDGSIDVEIAGGIPPFQYSWSHGAATEDVNNLSQGEYQLEVTDAEGTTITSPVYMVEADYYVEIENVDQTTEACDKRDGSITIEAVTNANSLLYDWSHEDSLKEMTASGLKAGKYTVTVTNEHGCIDTVATEVKATSGPVVVQDQVIQPDCKGTDYGQISIRIQGGHGVTSISWTGPDDFRSDEGEITDLTTGTYVVKLEDERGCMDSMSFSISEPEYPEGTVEVIPSGGGMSLGQILVSDVQGGVPPYQYVLYNEINNVVERNASGQFDSLNHGIYAVEIIDDDSCSTIYPDLSIILTNTGSIEENLSFAFSPNPASDHIRVNMNVPKNSSARVQIIDLLGKVVHDQFIGVGKSEVGIDIRDLSKGTYLIQLTAGEKRHVMALVK